MSRRWESGITLVEIIVVIAVLGILIAIGVYSYTAVHRDASSRATRGGLQLAVEYMHQERLANGEYPTALPADLQSDKSVTLTVAESELSPYYDSLTPVQHGVLFATICQELIDEGAGNGVNQGGVTEDYMMGCGNWNHDNMQITGWETEKYDTPLNKATLEDYANAFTTNDAWNKAAHEFTVKNFYGQLIERFEERGGAFPITSFWDSWATPSNGGVIIEPLPTDSSSFRPVYCIEAAHKSYPDVIWRATEEQKLLLGSCPA